MPLPTQTIIFFALPNRQQGWSESVYSALSPASANATIESNLSLRLALLASDCACIGFRSSVLGPPKDSLLREFSPGKFGKSLDGVAQNAETCLNYRGYTATRNRLFTFRGIPDTWIADGVRTPVGVNGRYLVEAWLHYLITASFGLTTPDPANAITHNAVITTGATAGVDATVANPVLGALVNYGDKVRIRGVKGNPIYNAVWKVSPNVPNTSFTLLGSRKYYISYAGDSTSQKISLTADPLTNWVFANCSTRNTGRPFGVPRGRASAKILRR